MPEPTPEEVEQAIEERYGVSARQHLAWREAAGETLPVTGPESWAASLYSDDELAFLPAGVASFAIGCGNPTSIAELGGGETVLDMGSGNGVDCFLAARLVGDAGRVHGVDMNGDMLALATRNLELIDLGNVDFRQGDLASLPIDDASVDVVISNCVVNLTSDKQAVLQEAFRVLKPGGRLRIADIVWTKTPTDSEQADLASWTGCVAGALEFIDYVPLLEGVDFRDAALTLRQVAEPGYASAYVSADKSA
jgi:SAM-dependent methyltransferase